MIYDRNKFIIVKVSYDFICDSFYTCRDYHMIFNRKGREATASIPPLHPPPLSLSLAATMPSWACQYQLSRCWLTMPTHQARRVLLLRPFLMSVTTSENSQLWNHLREQRTVTPLRQTMSKGWGPGVIDYGQSLGHSRRGRKSPMTRTWVRPHLRQVALGVVQMKQTAMPAMTCPGNRVNRAQVHEHGLLAITLKGPPVCTLSRKFT